MTHMIPDDIEQFTTSGEDAFYRFLSCVAKPDDSFVCWYSPEMPGQKLQHDGWRLRHQVSAYNKVSYTIYA